LGKKNNVFAALGLAASIGLNLAACIIIGMLAGKYADGFLGTYPWLMLIGTILGVLSGMWSIYKKIIDLER